MNNMEAEEKTCYRAMHTCKTSDCMGWHAKSPGDGYCIQMEAQRRMMLSLEKIASRLPKRARTL